MSTVTDSTKSIHYLLISRCWPIDSQTTDDLSHLLSAERQLHGLRIPRRIHLDASVDWRVFVLANECGAEARHLVLLAVNQHNVRRLQRTHELARLPVVGVRRERDVVDRAAQWKLLTGHGHDLGWLRQNVLRQRPLDAVPGNDDAVAAVGAPRFE